MNDDILDDVIEQPTLDYSDDTAIKNINILIIEINDHIKKVKAARLTLFAIAIIMIFSTALGVTTDPYEIGTTYIMIEGGVMILIFVLCGIAVRYKPQIAILTGFIIFILYIVLTIIGDPYNSIQGIIIRIIIIYYLLAGYLAARKLKKDTSKLYEMGVDEEKINHALKLKPISRLIRRPKGE